MAARRPRRPQKSDRRRGLGSRPYPEYEGSQRFVRSPVFICLIAGALLILCVLVGIFWYSSGQDGGNYLPLPKQKQTPVRKTDEKPVPAPAKAAAPKVERHPEKKAPGPKKPVTAPARPAYQWSDGNWYSIEEPSFVKTASPAGRAAAYERFSKYRVPAPGP